MTGKNAPGTGADIVPTLHSGTSWSVGSSSADEHEIRLVLTSLDEAKAWVNWLMEHCGEADQAG